MAMARWLDFLGILITCRHSNMINEVENEIQTMQNEFRNLRDLCRHAVSTMHPDEVRELDLERLMKEVVYDMEDIVEPWFIQMEEVNSTSDIMILITRRILIHNNGLQLKRKITSFKEGRLEPIKSRIQAYLDLQVVQKQADQVHSMKLKKEEPKIEAEKIVGFEDEAKILISYLMEETEDLDIISITGMPGIGKTTLAWKIYQDERIRDKFPTRIWFDDIPLDLHAKDLCLNILEQSCSNEFTKNDDESIINAVGACLKKSRFLLVLDGVWTANSWKRVVDLLPKTGKVLITSRDTSVCADANVARKSHKLRFLNEEESWDLLQLEVFGKLDECPQELRSSGKCIAKSCDGSPLAIVVVGTSLVVTSSTEAAKKLNDSLWRTVSKNITTYLTDYGQEHVLNRVELSYLKLPQRLQHCFLYLGVFPEDDEIPVRTLTRLWIAEGLVQDSRRLDAEAIAEQNLEEIAEQNLCRLIDTNLVMVGKTYPNGQVKTCRLHKVIYGFCKYKAGEQDFYQEIRVNSDRPISLTPNCRRLCIYSHLSLFLSSGEKIQRVRSILCFEKEYKVLQPKGYLTLPYYLGLLRVLECKYHRYTEFPAYLTELKYLRYISISGDDHLNVIPETISSLYYLESLVVDTQSPSLTLKANIWRMLKLRHLVTKAAIILAIRDTDHQVCEYLQTLTRLAAACCTEDVFEKAPYLKTLGIRGELASLLAAETLRKLERLENLKLINESAHAAADTHLHRQLHPNCFPPSLKRLTLSATYLGWESMSVLGKISSLEILKLKNNAFTGASWNTDADGFRGLVFLLIGTTDLVSWEASPHCFPRLECLVLNNCENLQKIPLTLEKRLHKLDAEKVSGSAVEPAREVEGQQQGRMQKPKHLALQLLCFMVLRKKFLELPPI